MKPYKCLLTCYIRGITQNTKVVFNESSKEMYPEDDAWTSSWAGPKWNSFIYLPTPSLLRSITHTHTHTHTQPYCISLKFLSDHMSILNVLHWLPLFSDYSLKTPTWIWCPVYCQRPCVHLFLLSSDSSPVHPHWWLYLSACTCTSPFVTILMLIIHYFTSVFPITRG